MPVFRSVPVALLLALVCVLPGGAAVALVAVPETPSARIVDEPYSDERGDHRELIAEAWTPRDSRIGEEGALVWVRCDVDPETELCVPGDALVGGHNAPAGQDFRWGVGTEWKSAGVHAELAAAGHSASAHAGTFHFWSLQYGYVEVEVDGEPVVSFFDAAPLPLP